MDINPNSPNTNFNHTSSTVTDSAARRVIDQLNAQVNEQRFQDQVSLSYKAQKLNMIQTEFFSGTIRSDQIHALTQRLFEDGLINSDELLSLGGFVPTQVSAVSESVHFLNSFIMDEAVDGDSEGAKALLAALEVIEQMDLAVTPERRQQEKEALRYVENYNEMLKETAAPADTVAGFEKVTEVLKALDVVRANEDKTGALASYASVEEAHQAMFKA